MNQRFPGLGPTGSEKPSSAPRAVARGADDIVELPLLLPGWEAAALEEAARVRGQTTAQVIRQLIRGYLTASA
jgi:hypothetical protein